MGCSLEHISVQPKSKHLYEPKWRDHLREYPRNDWGMIGRGAVGKGCPSIRLHNTHNVSKCSLRIVDPLVNQNLSRIVDNVWFYTTVSCTFVDILDH